MWRRWGRTERGRAGTASAALGRGCGSRFPAAVSLTWRESLGARPLAIEFTEETSSGGSGGMTEEEADARVPQARGRYADGRGRYGRQRCQSAPAPVNDGDAARKADVEGSPRRRLFLFRQQVEWEARLYTQNVTVSGISGKMKVRS